MMVALVVNMHACVTYSHVGGWYRMEAPEPAMAVKLGFIFWQGHLQSFFMGFLFFLGGVFADYSLARRGPANFLRERFRRLGLPSLLFMLLLQPFMLYVLLGHPHVENPPPLGARLANYLTSGRVFSGSGPMWFALALLAFSLVFVVVRRGKPAKSAPDVVSLQPPGGVSLFGFGVVLVATTFLTRLWQPIGTDVLNFQLCYFPQYVAAFAVGVTAGRGGWLETLARSRRAQVAGWLGLVGGPLVLAGIAAVGGPPPADGPNLYTGGWNLHAFALAAWEQFAGLSLALGSLAWFHRRWNDTGRVAAWLSERSFAVYMLHAPVLVGLTPILRPVAVHPYLGAALLTVLGLMVSYFLADLAKRMPGLRAIL